MSMVERVENDLTQKAKQDAPNYRKANGEPACLSCRFAGPDDLCRLYQFTFDRGYTCDSWMTAEYNDESEPNNAPADAAGPVPADSLRETEKSRGAVDDAQGREGEGDPDTSVDGVDQCRHTGVQSVSQKDMMMGLGGCVHKAGADPDTPVGEDEVGEAEDNQRDDEKKGPIQRIAEKLDEVFDEAARQIFTIINTTKAGKIRRKLRRESLVDIQRVIEEMQEEIAGVIVDDLAEIYAEAGIDAVDRIAGDIASEQVGVVNDVFNVTNPLVREAAEDFAERLARSVGETTAQKVADTLSQGLDAGESIQQLTQRVEDAGVFNPKRAEMIARTESSEAYQQGNMRAWKEVGIERKEFLLAPNACEFCRAVAKEYEGRSIPIDEPFVPKGSTITGVDGGTLKADYRDITSANIHPHCRCTIVPVVE